MKFEIHKPKNQTENCFAKLCDVGGVQIENNDIVRHCNASDQRIYVVKGFEKSDLGCPMVKLWPQDARIFGYVYEHPDRLCVTTKSAQVLKE